MPPPDDASSEMAPVGYPPTKKNASSPPSRILSPDWLGFRYSALMSFSVIPYAPRMIRASTSVPDPGSSSDTRLPLRSASVLMPASALATIWM